MHANNGIARATNGTFYVSDSGSGGLSILELQADNTLVLVDEVPVGAFPLPSVDNIYLMSLLLLDRAMDNLQVDSEGYIWAAGRPIAT